MAIRAAVLAFAFTTVVALHAPEDAVQKAIDQEMDMFEKDTRQYSHEGQPLTHNFLFKANGLTVKADEDGAPVCASTCRGDPADMVHPFYRYNKDSKAPQKVESFSVAKDTHFFNAADTAACVKDKYILFLGDSTLGENVNDIEYLLAGGPKKIKTESFMWAVTTQTKAKLSWDTDKGTMTDTFDVRNRKHGIKFKTQNTDMKFYFTGATELSHNCDGISAMLDQQLRKRIAEFTQSTGRKPDAIVMNSGPHDACRAWIKKDNYTAFFENVDQVGREVIKPWVDQGIKVIFRGSYRFSGETAVKNPKFGDNRIPKEIDDPRRQWWRRMVAPSSTLPAFLPTPMTVPVAAQPLGRQQWPCHTWGQLPSSRIRRQVSS
jgi:hypothetical protein